MLVVSEIETKPYDDQKMGTSGLRKKTTIFQQENYVANFAEAVFLTLHERSQTNPQENPPVPGSTIIISGDGRYFMNEAFWIIAAVAFAHGISRILIGERCLMSTPAVSCLIRRRKCAGAFILTASHNPGGPGADFGIKYNGPNGAAVPESISDSIFQVASTLKSFHTVSPTALAAAVDTTAPPGAVFSLTVSGIAPPAAAVSPGLPSPRTATVEVVSTTADYFAGMSELFDWAALRRLLAQPNVSLCLDAMHGIAGPYLHRLFSDPELLGERQDTPPPRVHLLRCDPLPDFGGHHPDPNLAHAQELVRIMRGDTAPPGSDTSGPDPPTPPTLGAAFDGDADRNMILGGSPYCFASPSDSLAVIAANADAIPYFRRNGLPGVARSMPTGTAVDAVMAARGRPVFAVPTGWKFFCNLMDSGLVTLCGEESFGTGAAYAREKDGIFALLCWLSILADRLRDAEQRGTLDPLTVSVRGVLVDLWRTYGRSLYTRYDYENRDTPPCDAMLAQLTSAIVGGHLNGREFRADFPLDFVTARVGADAKGFPEYPQTFKVASAEVFEYTDPVDGSISRNQGWIIRFEGGSRIVVRRSGTGSTGTTLRVYLEVWQDKDRVDVDADVRLSVRSHSSPALPQCHLDLLRPRYLILRNSCLNPSLTL